MTPRGVDTRSGHLAALFRWQSSKREQLENFCTEALASAIVADPMRFLALLEQHNKLPTNVKAAEITEVEYGKDSLGIIADQDIGITTGQQLGLRSRGYRGANLADQESRIARFHAVIDEYIAGERS